MLNFIYYPVSAIMWFWHKVFGFVFGAASGIAWALAVVFLVFTLRALLYKPFVHQVRSMRKMQEFAPEMQKLRAKYGNDKQKLAAEMQKLQSQQGVNPLGGCLPVLVQVPVFIGLFHVLREFTPRPDAELHLRRRRGRVVQHGEPVRGEAGCLGDVGLRQLAELGTSIPSMLIVMIPLMIAAGTFTHITARHSVARQTEAQLANPQSAIMNKMMLYVFPVGVVVGAPFLPLAVLLYWVANNLWTLGQQHVVYRKIDVEEAEKKAQAVADRQSRAPRPGQKPVRPEVAARPEKTPGAKPITRRAESNTNGSPAKGAASSGSGAKSAPGSGSGSPSAASTNGAATNGTTAGGAVTRPAARRPRKRR